MRDILQEIGTWHAAGRAVALATVVKVWGSAPRPIGSKMAISDAGDMAGSVSGGCVEGAVFEEAQGVLQSGRPHLVGYGVTQEEAWAVGLSCGGRIEIFVEPLAADNAAKAEGALPFSLLRQQLEADRLFAVATRITGDGAGRQLLILPEDLEPGAPARSGTGLGTPELDHQVRERTRVLFRTFASERANVPVGEENADVFIEIHPPKPRLIIVGAVHTAIPLVGFAKTLGFRTLLVDPRTAFATRERFPHADELITDWPDEALERIGLTENTYLALLSHDQKLDVPALRVALPSPVRYIGALGSKKTHGKRVDALREEGVAEELIGRMHNPIGLDLGGRRAEEMAVAIIAQILAVRHGRDLR